MYLYIKDDGFVYGYHTQPNDLTTEVNVTKAWIEQYVGKVKYTDGQFYLIEQQDKQPILDELFEIAHWFAATDYYNNKIITGEWETTDERWVGYLAERTVKRTRQDELNLLLDTSETLTPIEPEIVEEVEQVVEEITIDEFMQDIMDEVTEEESM